MNFLSVFSSLFGNNATEDSKTTNTTTTTPRKKMAAYLEGEEYLIGFVSDLEGNYSYWNNYKKISKVLTIDLHTQKLVLKPNCYFVHGGDVVDRGNGDIRILRDLIQLKNDFPDRVFFIIGNRDANKLRLYFSLHDTVLKYRPDAYWVAPAQVPADFPLENQKEKLLWVLKATMGAPFAFENRREELQELNPGRTITDLDVISSFLSLVHPERPDNLLLQYLKHGSMAVVIGDTLFVHGAVTPFELGYVPPSYDRKSNRPTEKRYILDDPHAWVQAINGFLASELKDYEESFYSYQEQLKNTSSWEELKELLWDSKGDYESPQPGSRLAQCGMGMKYDKSPNPGTTYASYLSNGKPVRINEDVANWLHRGGLNKVIVGHQPNGDTPLIIDHLNVVTISGDSSYSKFLMWQPQDIAKSTFLSAEEKTKLAEVASQDFVGLDKALTTHLGKTLPAAVKASEQANTRSDLAVNEVVISFNQRVLPFAPNTSVRGKVSVHGKISLGAQYDSSDADPFVGKETSDGWFVKAANARFEGDPTTYYVLAQSEGFNFRSKLVPISQIEALFPRA